ncbi:hypothetical protein [Ferrovibrio terrae]|uniref:hypothetical protein n=1 Tax=Ferrovibrio terrae TaxID=2594003 RepID=UPI0031381F77
MIRIYETVLLQHGAHGLQVRTYTGRRWGVLIIYHDGKCHGWMCESEVAAHRAASRTNYVDPRTGRAMYRQVVAVRGFVA